MAKIPVGATIAQAYRFAFRDFLKILGVMWLTMAIMWIPSLLMRDQMMAVAGHDAGAIHRLLPFLIPLYIVMMVLMMMQIIGIAKLALGTHTGPYWYYFSLGKPLWRLIGSLLLLLLALIIGYVVAILGALLIGFLLLWLGRAVDFPALTATLHVATVLAVAILWCGYIYCVVRLSFLLMPVIAAEDGEAFALARAWTLGKDNFWRMLVILIVVLLPFLLLEGIFVYHLFQSAPFPTQPATAEQVAAFQAAINANTMAMLNFTYRYWYLIYPPAIVVMVLLYGVAVGAQCFAYRSLTSGPVARDALPD